MATDRTVSARNAEAITPGDSGSGAANGEVAYCRGLFIGGAGNVYVDMVGVGTNIPMIGCPAGAFYPIEITRIYDTNTTATNILVFW